MMKVLALLLLLVAIVTVESAVLIDRDVQGLDIIPNSYIIVLKDTVTKAQKNEHVLNLQHLILESGSEGGVGFVFDVINGFSASLTDILLNLELLNPDVAYIESNKRVKAFDIQTNPEWGLDRIDQRSATRDMVYNYNSSAGENTDVYIVDTGIRTTHSEFEGRATTVFNAINGESSEDLNGHGSHVAGIVGGKTYGVAKKTQLKAVKVLGATGGGSTDGVIAGINFITNNKSSSRKSVVNMSLGGPLSTALDAAVRNSISQGVVYAVAAGNDGFSACFFSPARVTEAITVGATTITNQRALYSNFGSCVDLFAPGSDIKSSWFNSDSATNTISGTSMATPFVAGVLAVQLGDHPSLSPLQVKNWMISSSTPNAVSLPGLFSPNRLLFSPSS